jgi:hypothetical protein
VEGPSVITSSWTPINDSTICTSGWNQALTSRKGRITLGSRTPICMMLNRMGLYDGSSIFRDFTTRRSGFAAHWDGIW